MYEIANVTTFTFFNIIDFYPWQRLSTEQNYLLANGANILQFGLARANFSRFTSFISGGSLPRSRFLDVTQRFGGALRDIQKTAARETIPGATLLYIV